MNVNERSCKKYRCNLCKKYYTEKEMSEEHYPARSVGNEDIVALDIVKMLDMFQSKDFYYEMKKRQDAGETIDKISDEIFDTRLTKTLHPNGRTSKTLCITCNTFLGKYDEAYLKFFEAEGNPLIIRGFQNHTKHKIIKSMYAKFLSIPEAKDEEFDFHDFVRNEKSLNYDGKWNLYFVKRDYSSDLMGFNDIGTGRGVYDDGIVYELSDDKFIYNLMNFEKHSCFEMTDIFDILNKNYKLVVGVGKNGGYHAQILVPRLFSETED